MAVILVIDDDLDVVETIEMVLGESGHAVVGTALPDEAIRLAREHRPGVILLDYYIPGLDPARLVASLRAVCDARIQLCTAAEGASDLARDAGADGVLRKPFSIDELLTLVAGEPAQPRA